MEELHRLHKDVPFGWLLWVQHALDRRGRKAPRSAKVRTGGAARV